MGISGAIVVSKDPRLQIELTEWACQENKGRRNLTDSNIDCNFPAYDLKHSVPSMASDGKIVYKCSVTTFDDPSIASAVLLGKRDAKSVKPMSPVLENTDIDACFQLWYRLVINYSSRRLTISSDSLLAISAIAAQIQPLLDDEYCARHWKSRLHMESRWRTVVPLRNRAVRPSEYRAPSWSWASVSAPIDEIVSKYSALT